MRKSLNFLRLFNTRPITQLAYIYVIITFLFITTTNQYQITKAQQQREYEDKNNVGNHFNFLSWTSADHLIQNLPFVRSSVPLQRMYECIREFSILRCTKLFVLQRMENHPNFVQSGNLTLDFLHQFFDDDKVQMSSLISEKYVNITEDELNERLTVNFQRFFKNRDIKLHFLPGIVVNIIPSQENKLKFTLRKKKKGKYHANHHSGRAIRADIDVDNSLDGQTLSEGDSKLPESIGDGGGLGGGPGIGGGGIGGGGVISGIGKKVKKPFQSYKNTIIQLAVPIMLMPAILLGTFLPFILPVLKIATIITLLMNNGAFLAALMYAARTHANTQEEQHINYNYGHSSFH